MLVEACSEFDTIKEKFAYGDESCGTLVQHSRLSLLLDQKEKFNLISF